MSCGSLGPSSRIRALDERSVLAPCPPLPLESASTRPTGSERLPKSTQGPTVNPRRPVGEAAVSKLDSHRALSLETRPRIQAKTGGFAALAGGSGNSLHESRQ